MNPKTWVEIDLEALRHNVSAIRNKLQPRTKILAVVKANAYGHDSSLVAPVLDRSGVDAFGVATPWEGKALKKLGIKKPILLLVQALPQEAEKVVEAGLEASVCTLDLAEALSRAASRLARSLKRPSLTANVHIKVDTGMGRLGIFPQDVLPFMEKVSRLPHLRIKGIFSHFPLSYPDKQFSLDQIKMFNRTLTDLEGRGLGGFCRHMANSTSLLSFPESHLDMVRPGLILYGLYPHPAHQRHISLKPVLTLKTRVDYLKRVPAGTGISYGHTFRTKKPTLIATLPVGYGDGYLRRLGNQAEVLLHGKRVPVVGVVCMDACMVDAGKIKNARIGDEVVLIGRQGKDIITVEEIAKKLNTINYEVTTLITQRVRRVAKTG